MAIEQTKACNATGSPSMVQASQHTRLAPEDLRPGDILIESIDRRYLTRPDVPVAQKGRCTLAMVAQGLAALRLPKLNGRRAPSGSCFLYHTSLVENADAQGVQVYDVRLKGLAKRRLRTFNSDTLLVYRLTHEPLTHALLAQARHWHEHGTFAHRQSVASWFRGPKLGALAGQLLQRTLANDGTAGTGTCAEWLCLAGALATLNLVPQTSFEERFAALQHATPDDPAYTFAMDPHSAALPLRLHKRLLRSRHVQAVGALTWPVGVIRKPIGT